MTIKDLGQEKHSYYGRKRCFEPAGVLKVEPEKSDWPDYPERTGINKKPLQILN